MPPPTTNITVRWDVEPCAISNDLYIGFTSRTNLSLPRTILTNRLPYAPGTQSFPNRYPQEFIDCFWNFKVTHGPQLLP